MFAIVETNQQSWNESLVRLSWRKRKTNKCHTNYKVKYKTWQLTFNQYGEHNCYILLITKSFFNVFFKVLYTIVCYDRDMEVPDESYSRNALCALDFDMYVFITARRNSFVSRRDSLLLIVYTYVTLEYHAYCNSGFSCESLWCCSFFGCWFAILVYCYWSIVPIFYHFGLWFMYHFL